MTQRKLVFALTALLALALSLSAPAQESTQEPAQESAIHHEIYASYGSCSTYSALSNGVAAMFVALFGGENIDFNSSGVIHLGYNCLLFNDHLSLGALGSFEYTSLSASGASADLTFVTLQARLAGQYGFKRFKFYQAVSAGFCIIANEFDTPYLALNVTPIGFKFYATENILIFADLNLGTGGLLNVGLSLRL
jgi:hypothetical protein